MKERIEGLVHEALIGMAEDRNDELLRSPEPDTPLFGKGGTLDSISLVGLLADIEALVSESLEVDIVLASERAMSKSKSPFRTVSALVEFTIELVEEGERA